MLVFNGEIYNFQAIRDELVEKGHVFRTRTDSEVLLHGYEEYGPALLDRRAGMYAFVIWGQRGRASFRGSGHLRHQALYYYHRDGAFLFGSEIKSFLEHPDFKKSSMRSGCPTTSATSISPTGKPCSGMCSSCRTGEYFLYENGRLSIHKYFDAVDAFQWTRNRS